MSQVGCYSSLPSSYSDKSTYQYQSSSHCSDECSGYSYFALQGGNTCICGNDAPSGSKSSDCNTPCFGYGEEMCGGSNAYMIFSTGNGGGGNSGNSGSSSNAQSSTSTSNTGTSSTTGSNTQTSSSTTSSNTQTSKTSTTSSKETQVTQSVSGSTIVVMSTVAVSATPTSSASESQTQSTSSSSTSPSSSSSSSSGSSKPSKKTNLIGPVVGGVVGGVGLIALVSVLFFFLRRRSSKSRDAELADSAYYDAIKRDNSTVARPLSNPFLSKEEFTDQRLNPVMLGRRRISEGSLADEADYSRKILRVANPDDDL